MQFTCNEIKPLLLGLKNGTIHQSR